MSGVRFGKGRERVKSTKQDWPHVKVSDHFTVYVGNLDKMCFLSHHSRKQVLN